MQASPPAKRGPGRPPKPPGEAKRDFYQARIRGALKKRLEEEAALQGRSLSEEIEVRLEQSVSNADLRAEYGPAGAVAAAIIGRTLAELNRAVPFPLTWVDRPDMIEEAAWAAATVFAAFGLDRGPLVETLTNLQGMPRLEGGFHAVVAPKIVWGLLGAVKGPDEIAGAELREWARPLHAMLGQEIAARLRVPTWIETFITDEGKAAVHVHPTVDLVGPGRETE